MNNTVWKPESNPLAALRSVRAALADAGLSSPQAEAHQILAAVVAKPLIVADDLSPAQLERIGAIVRERRKGIPLQHVLGEMTFCHLQLKSDARALVVRPETELLATWAIAALGQLEPCARQVIDVGTGSGNLALAIATSVPNTKVRAIDISPAALALASENVERYRQVLSERDSSVQLVHADVRELRDHNSASVLVSNPPYLPAGETVFDEVCFDPQSALYGGGVAGLDLPEATIAFGAAALRKGGVMLLEHHHTQSQALRRYARSCGFRDVQTLNDLTGRQRFLQARMCQPATNRGKIEA